MLCMCRVLQVAELEKKVHSRRGGAVPDVLSASAAIREAACRLHQIAKKELSRIKDKVSTSDSLDGS